MANGTTPKSATRDALIAAIITNFVIPEIVAFIKARVDAGKPVPTSAEVIANLPITIDKYLPRGEAFLAQFGIVIP